MKSKLTEAIILIVLGLLVFIGSPIIIASIPGIEKLGLFALVIGLAIWPVIIIISIILIVFGLVKMRKYFKNKKAINNVVS